MKNCNNSRLPWEEAAAPKGVAAHSFGTTALHHSMPNVHLGIWVYLEFCIVPLLKHSMKVFTHIAMHLVS